MSNILIFTKMKLGEVINMELRGISCKCKILEHLGEDKYKIKILNGSFQGQTAILTMTRWKNEY